MKTKKKKAIPSSFYYDGRKKEWKTNNFETPDRPTPDAVRSWIRAWENTEGYPEQESALDKLFESLCPNNVDLDDILIKVCTLNDFYSTNIYKVIEIAKVIQRLSIDSRLDSAVPDTRIVDDIVAGVQAATGRSVYSFASKYCSHHRPKIYPIYDSYVDTLLRYYRDSAKSADFAFSDDDLHNYASFCLVEDKFKSYYGLEEFNAKEIDKFLWQVGKKCFPKWENTDDNGEE